jgi:hypothetical protein
MVDHLVAVEWFHKSAEQGYADAQISLGFAYIYDETDAPRSMHEPFTVTDECTAVEWLRKAAALKNEEAQETLLHWDAILGNGSPNPSSPCTSVASAWAVIYDPDTRSTVVAADNNIDYRWEGGTAGEMEREEAFAGESQQHQGMLQRMSPWVVRCVLNHAALVGTHCSLDEVRGRVEEASRECGCDASVVNSCETFPDADGADSFTLRVRLLVGRDTIPQILYYGWGGSGSTSDSTAAATAQDACELTVCCPDGTSYKLDVLPPTTVLEVKQSVRSALWESSGALFDMSKAFWQDEHAVQRQHIFVHGVEDELADAQSMVSLGNPAALFLMVDTEASFMERLEAEAVALRVRLEGVKLRDLARCDAETAARAAPAKAAELKVAEAAAAAAGAGAGAVEATKAAVADGGAQGHGAAASGPPCKKSRSE